MNNEARIASGHEGLRAYNAENSVNYVQYQDGQSHEGIMEQNTGGRDLNYSQYQENTYPGWRYDSSSGQ